MTLKKAFTEYLETPQVRGITTLFNLSRLLEGCNREFSNSSHRMPHFIWRSSLQPKELCPAAGPQ
jgi:hypothetical protein